MWDQGLTMLAVEGRLWPIPLRCEEERLGTPEAGWGDEVRTNEGAVLVASGLIMQHRGTDRARRLLDRLPWALFIHTSDEELAFDSRQFKKANTALWVQCASPLSPVDGDRRIVLGPQVDTAERLRSVPRRPAAERKRWVFTGQVNNHARQACGRHLCTRNDGEFTGTPGFSLGIDRQDYLKQLVGAAIAPCPSGSFTPETFRCYEALEAGALPVCNRRASFWPRETNYWMHVLGQEPFPCLDDWKEIHELIDRYAGDPLGLQRDTNAACAWWEQHKRDYAWNLFEDVRALGGATMDMKDMVTVMIPTSPVPSHPSTAMLEECVRRVRGYEQFKNAECILMFDGVREEQAHRASAYEEYKRRVLDLCKTDPLFHGCLPLVFERHTHQANMMRRALDHVKTPFLFYVEHDTWPVGEIDFDGIVRVLHRDDVHNVRLHIFDHVLGEHMYLMVDKERQDVDGVPMMRTIQWSQRPHLAKTSYYRDLIREFFGREARTMIEDVMYGVVFNSVNARHLPWSRFGMWLYTPPGNTYRSGHANGRDGDPKYNMVFAYDGAIPFGAPR